MELRLDRKVSHQSFDRQASLYINRQLCDKMPLFFHMLRVIMLLPTNYIHIHPFQLEH
jgi:hypothetical protein